MKKVLTLIAALAMLFTVAVMPVSAAEAAVEKPASIMPANFDVASADFSNSNNQSLRNEWIWWLQDGKIGHHEVKEAELADGSTGKVCMVVGTGTQLRLGKILCFHRSF